MIEVGAALVRAGLHRKALAAWAGTDRIPALRVAALRDRPITPASAALALFVAGVDVTRDQLRLVADRELDVLVEHHIAIRDGDRLRAARAILPVGHSFVLCDRFDAPAERERVSWPDDSSYHLIGALPPGRVPRWLDLGCGSAFAQLARPQLAQTRIGAELNTRAAWYAVLGAGISNVELSVSIGDLDGEMCTRERLDECAIPPFDLVTCNAPIPGDGDATIWRATDAAFFPRLHAAIHRRLAPGGLAVLHGALDALLPLLDTGERVIVAYTPPDVRGFAVAWWRPDGEDRQVAARRALTSDRPHVDHEDRAAALAGTLPAL